MDTLPQSPQAERPRFCRHCTHSLSQLLNGKPQLICMMWRRLAHEACSEWMRATGSDDDHG
jgi:hypothetical protein